MIIAIDGKYGVGKTTTAKCLARRLGYNYLSTGAIFRAIALKVIEVKIEKEDKEAIIKIAKEINIEVKQIDKETKIFIDGKDLTEKAYTHNEKIDSVTSYLGRNIPEVTEIITKLQREIAKSGNFIFEGRDMTSRVFPNADWKFYIQAEMMKRAERMYKILPDEEKETYPTIEDYSKLDHFHKEYPGAEDAIVYDNTYSPTPEQDAIVLEYYITHPKEILGNIGKIKDKKEPIKNN
jgi:cytidylate kinase